LDLNSDVGESFGVYKIGLDEEVIPLITSANIACGYHAGDPSVMRRTVALAKKHGVALGAHPGLPDLVGFGRRAMDVSYEEIVDYLTYQIGALQAFAVSEGLSLQHVKPHGALYNMAVQDLRIWEAASRVLAKIDPKLILVVIAGPGQQDIRAIGATYGIRVAFEFFADRAYHSDGSLVSRKEPGAVIQEHARVSERVQKLAREGKVLCSDGSDLQLEADTICVHGDNPQAVTLARVIREALGRAGVTLSPMGAFL
jgi:UPF0271 protein